MNTPERHPQTRKIGSGRLSHLILPLLMLVGMTCSCTPNTAENSFPLAYKVTMRIDVNGESSQPQSVNVLPGQPAGLAFNNFSPPIAVRLIVSPGPSPEGVEVKAKFHRRDPEFPMDWESLRMLGRTADMTATTAEPPVSYRIWVTADPASENAPPRSMSGSH